MLHIEGLTVSVGGTSILRGLDLDIDAGEVHAIMGPNGAGKSTLAQVLAGRDGYDVSGTVTFNGVDLLGQLPEERAAAGLFLAFQYPVEIAGVGNTYFLRTAVNAVREARGLETHDARAFLGLAKEHMERLDIDSAFLRRSVNTGLSGGEKKPTELLQMTKMEPLLAILHQTDSGLDIDALRVVANGVQRLRTPERSMLIITHYPRLLEYVVPDFVHVLDEGRILRTGDASLAHELEAHGYAERPDEAGAPVATS
jgi:Fe-S cluster assembly ATP-binding protein